MQPRESQIQGQILNYLRVRPGKYWRQNTGGATYKGKGQKQYFVKFGVKGAADITGIKDGRRIEIEVKRPGNDPKPEQRAFGDMIREQGGLYLVAYSLEDVREAGL